MDINIYIYRERERERPKKEGENIDKTHLPHELQAFLRLSLVTILIVDASKKQRVESNLCTQQRGLRRTVAKRIDLKHSCANLPSTLLRFSFPNLPANLGDNPKVFHELGVPIGGLIDHPHEMRGGFVVHHPAAVDELKLVVVHELLHQSQSLRILLLVPLLFVFYSSFPREKEEKKKRKRRREREEEEEGERGERERREREKREERREEKERRERQRTQENHRWKNACSAYENMRSLFFARDVTTESRMNCTPPAVGSYVLLEP